MSCPVLLVALFESSGAGEYRRVSEFFFDTEELVIFRETVRARGRACFYLPRVQGDAYVRYGRILGLAASVGYDGGVAGSPRHVHRRDGFRKRAYLVPFHEYLIFYSFF